MSFDDDAANENVNARKMLKVKHAGKGRNCSYWPVNIWALCSGENLQVRGAILLHHAKTCILFLQKPEVSKHLFCWLESEADSFLKIAPLKIEFLSRNPDVVQIHQAFQTETVVKNSEVVVRNLQVILTGPERRGNLDVEDTGEPVRISQFLPGVPTETQVDAAVSSKL